MEIKQISAREILDSRGNPTVECVVELSNGIVTCASVPSGASVGEREAIELRDGDKSRYNGLGVLKAVQNIEEKILPSLVNRPVGVQECDKIMLDLDGTANKKVLGANAILPVSIAIARAQAVLEGKALHELLGEFLGHTGSYGVSTTGGFSPSAMFNILNGGVHATNNIKFQEFMIMPSTGGKDCDFDKHLHMAVLVYKKLRDLLIEKGYETGVGDEGGFAPRINATGQSREVLDLLLKAVESAGFEPGRDVLFCLDVAASQFYNKTENQYVLGKNKMSSAELIDEYRQLIQEYPIYSIEDGLDENDWDGWKMMTDDIGKKVILVGDDIFVSNSKYISKGAEEGVANAVLIKPNQIGSVTETLKSIATAKRVGYKVVISHRSGETCDTFIADLAIASRAEFFKAGAPARGERVAKYNRLLTIASTLS